MRCMKSKNGEGISAFHHKTHAISTMILRLRHHPGKRRKGTCVCAGLQKGKHNIKEGDPHGSRAHVVAWGAIKNQASAQGACLLSCLAPTGVASEGLAWARTSGGLG